MPSRRTLPSAVRRLAPEGPLEVVADGQELEHDVTQGVLLEIGFLPLEALAQILHVGQPPEMRLLEIVELLLEMFDLGVLLLELVLEVPADFAGLLVRLLLFGSRRRLRFVSGGGRRCGDELDLVAGLVFFVRHKLTSLPKTVMARLTRLAIRSTSGMILS